MSTQQPLTMREKAIDEFPIMEDKPGNIVLFYPHIPAIAIDAVGLNMRASQPPAGELESLKWPKI